jgi:hypothetical protein
VGACRASAGDWHRGRMQCWRICGRVCCCLCILLLWRLWLLEAAQATPSRQPVALVHAATARRTSDPSRHPRQKTQRRAAVRFGAHASTRIVVCDVVVGGVGSDATTTAPLPRYSATHITHTCSSRASFNARKCSVVATWLILPVIYACLKD